MSIPLKILIVEDLKEDYELALRELKKGGLRVDPMRVETESQMRAAMKDFKPDLVISDFTLPGFDGKKALKAGLETDPFIPFIIYTGSIDEETAVECLKSGATDYIIKDSRVRLPYAVKEALEKKKAIRQKEETLSKLKESEFQLKRSQKIANIGNWKLDLQTGVIKASEEAQKIYGVSQENIPVELIRKMALEKYRKMLDVAIYHNINSGKPYDVEYEIMRASDKQVRFVHSMAEYYPEQKCFIGIIKDITETKNNEKLKQEILVANESTRFKQKFLAQISHEIRTPLTAIDGITELLEKTPLNDSQKDYLETLKFASGNLRNIINEVLDYSKIEAGKIKIQPESFPVNELVIRAEKLFLSICKKPLSFKVKGIHSLPKYIHADKHRVFQIITNLISNAVKYSNTGTITLEFKDLRQKKAQRNTFKVMVRDEGPGIQPQLKKNLFKPFSQIHQQENIEIEGTGLGLSICKELAALLEGEVGVESEPGHGSTFWFTFLAGQAKESAKETPKQNTSSSSGKRLNILLAEDKAINQKVITLILSSLGHTIVVVENGQQVLEKFTPHDYDLILMDIQMPVMDGIEATQKLRTKFTSLPPIVGLSANAMEGDREKYIKLGMDEYITKPVKSGDFNKLIQRLGV